VVVDDADHRAIVGRELVPHAHTGQQCLSNFCHATVCPVRTALPRVGDLAPGTIGNVFATDVILPPPPDDAAAVLHDREYRVRAFRMAGDRLLIQGAIRDQKPPGLYIPEDPEPMTIHHMQLSLEIAFPQLEITDAGVHFESHPHGSCPSITAHYGNLVGLSIARGFTHRVRELFGGPRGCTHTTALLQAMAPVAMQCFWSMRAAQAREDGQENPLVRGMDGDDGWKRIVNTCHVWDEHGPAVAAREAGADQGPPIWLSERMVELGIKVTDRGNPDPD